MKVGFKDFKIDCIVGLLDFERTQIQPLILNLDLDIDLGPTCFSDVLGDDSVDYTQASAILQQFIIQQQFFTLEALVYQSAQLLLQSFASINHLNLSALKPQAITQAQGAYVSLYLGRGSQ